MVDGGFPRLNGHQWGYTLFAWYVGTIGHRMLNKKGMMSFTWDTTGKFLRVCPGHWSGWNGTRGIWIILALTWDIISENCVPQNPRVPHIVLFGIQWDYWDVLFPVPTSSIENLTIWIAVSWLYFGKPHMTNSNFINMFDHLGDNLTPFWDHFWGKPMETNQDIYDYHLVN